MTIKDWYDNVVLKREENRDLKATNYYLRNKVGEYRQRYQGLYKQYQRTMERQTSAFESCLTEDSKEVLVDRTYRSETLIPTIRITSSTDGFKGRFVKAVCSNNGKKDFIIYATEGLLDINPDGKEAYRTLARSAFEMFEEEYHWQ